MMTDITPTFPLIHTKYSKALLLTPMPKIRDDEEDLKNLLVYLSDQLSKRLRYSGKAGRKCRATQIAMENFAECYERIKERKENSETKMPNKTQRPFYYFKGSLRIYDDILKRSKRISRANKLRNLNKI